MLVPNTRGLGVMLISVVLLFFASAYSQSTSSCQYNNVTLVYAEELVAIYGSRARLDLKQFRQLARSVKASSSESRDDDEYTSADSKWLPENSTSIKCLTVDEIYDIYSDVDGLRAERLVEALSILFYMSVKSKCHLNDQQVSIHLKPTNAQVWGYGIGFVTLICVISNIGGLLSPLMKKEFFQKLLTFLVAMAVGTLAATGLMVLLPEAFDIMSCEELADDYLWKASTAMAGIYLFYMSERMLKVLFYKHETLPSETLEIKIPLSDDQGHGHSHLPGNMAEEVQSGRTSVSTVAWMVLIGDALHNFVDGLSIGAAFTENIYTGVSVSIAVVCEELPHELGDVAILLHSGLSMKRALLYNFLAAVICYAGLIIGIVLGENTSANRWIFAIAGGLFLYVSLVDMLPELSHTADEFQRQKANPWKIMALQNCGLILGFGIILIVAYYAGQIVI